MIKNLPTMQETRVRSLGWEDPLENILLGFKTFYFWLCWVFVAARATLQLQCAGFSFQWLLAMEHRLQSHRLQQLRLPGSRAQAQQLWHTGLVAQWHVESSPIRDQTCVSCTGRGILYHLAPREALHVCFKIMIFFTKQRDSQEQARIPDRYLFMIFLLQVSIPKSSHSRRTFQQGLSLLLAESPDSPNPGEACLAFCQISSHNLAPACLFSNSHMTFLLTWLQPHVFSLSLRHANFNLTVKFLQFCLEHSSSRFSND